MKVYIVRHGQTKASATNCHGSEEEDLTELGINQAENLKSKIKDYQFDIIISSPLIRAKHTANIINVNNNKIIYDNRLKERNPGNLSGKSRENENREEYWNYYSIIQHGTSENIKIFLKEFFIF